MTRQEDQTHVWSNDGLEKYFFCHVPLTLNQLTTAELLNNVDMYASTRDQSNMDYTHSFLCLLFEVVLRGEQHIYNNMSSVQEQGVR